MKLDDMLLEQRSALSICVIECDGLRARNERLEERNEKLEKVAKAAKAWLAVADTYAKHRDDPDRSIYKVDYMQGREIFRGALSELEQP